MRKAISLAAAAALALVVFALPAGATVDELTGMPCSGGNAVFGPPGISDPTKGNFAKPLFATGFATMSLDTPEAGDVTVTFNPDHPASKIRLLGPIVEVEPGFFLTIFEWDETKPPSNKCKKFDQPH